MPEVVDTCSLATPASVCRTKHLHLRCSVDFTRRALTGTAALTIQSQEDNLRSLVQWTVRPAPASAQNPAAAPSQAHAPVGLARPSGVLCSPCPSLFCTSSLAPTPFSTPSSSRLPHLIAPPSQPHLPSPRTCVSSSLQPPVTFLVPPPLRAPHPALRFQFGTNPLTPISSFLAIIDPVSLPISSASSPELSLLGPRSSPSPQRTFLNPRSDRSARPRPADGPIPTLPSQAPLFFKLVCPPDPSLDFTASRSQTPSSTPPFSPSLDTSSPCQL